MDDRMRGIRDGAAVGGVIGGALGTLLQGAALVLPGGRELMLVRAAAVIIPRSIRASGTAIGTLVGAAVGAQASEAGRSLARAQKRADMAPRGEKR